MKDANLKGNAMNAIRSMTAVAAAVAGFAIANACAAHVPDHVADPNAPAVADGYAEGEVRRVDKDAGKVTLKHGPIANLDMPAMSMVFRAKDPTLLDKLKEGDKVRFKAEKIQGALTVTEIQPAK